MINRPQISIVRNTSSSYVGRTLISSDHHTPFECKRKTKALDELTKEFKPNRYIMAGDVGDTTLASRFVEMCLVAVSNKLKIPDTATEFEIMVKYMDRRADIAKSANSKVELHYIMGNHEYRIYKQLDKVRHLIGSHDPLANAIALSRHTWNQYDQFPHGAFLLCDDPKNKVYVKHAGKGTGANHGKATWTHTVAIDYSLIYGDSHKTMKFEGACAPNVALRDDRFSLGLGGIGNWNNREGFGYAGDEARAHWDGGVACVDQKKSGKMEIWIEYL